MRRRLAVVLRTLARRLDPPVTRTVTFYATAVPLNDAIERVTKQIDWAMRASLGGNA